MGIVINDPDTVALIMRRQAETGKTAEAVVREALESRLADAPQAMGSVEERRARLRAITGQAAREATNRHVSDDELVGYDSHGLPA